MPVSKFGIKGHYIISIGITVLFTSFLDNILFPSFLHSSQGRSSLFILLSFVSLYASNIAIQFVLLRSAVKMNLIINKTNKPSLYDILIVTVFGFLVFLLFLLCTQLFENRNYSVYLFIIVIVYGLLVSSIIISILIFKLSTWVKRKTNFHGFLYVTSFSMILVTLTSSALGLAEELVGRPSPVTSIPNPWDNISTRQPEFYNVYRISSLVSFGLFWLATSILLKNYSTKRIGKWKYWILVSLPMIYYIGTIDFLLNNYLNSLIFQYPNFATIIFYLLGITKQLGGFFFALSFIFMAKNIENIKLKFYLQLTGIGIMILFSSIQISTLHILPYPPFGLITLSIMPISSYLVLIGLYYSAKSLSYDKKFLSELKKQIKNESNMFLNAIGSAEWNKNLEVTIHGVLKQMGNREEMDYSLKQEDVRSYVVDVIKELKKER